MSRALLAEEIKRLLPGEENKRIRQAILLAYGGAAGVARGVRNEIDQENRLRTGILVNGQVNITSPTSATLTDWAWVIDFAVQQNNGQTLTILAPDAEFVRVDFFHGDNAGIIHYTPGIIDIEGNSIFPNIPQDHVILKKILRNPDGSNTEGPVDGSDSLITFIEDFVIPMTLGNKLVRSGLRKTADRFAFDGRVGGLPAVNADEFVTMGQLPQQSQYGILSGGQIQWSRSGFTYNLSAVVYAINGVISVPSTQVTLPAAHPTLDRFDVIGWDINGNAFFIEGIPDANPVIPQIDFQTQVYGTAILVKAGQTSPISELNETIIYAENAEWTVSSSGTGTINPASTNNPLAGSVSIEVTASQHLFQLIFTAPENIDLDDFETVGLLLRLKAAFPSGQGLTMFWTNASGQAISNPLIMPLDASILTTQFIAVDLSQFTFQSKIARQLRIQFFRQRGSNNHAGFFMDNVKLEGGITQPNPPSGGVSIHNLLQQIQGGSETERYHLTKSQWDAVENANNPSASNPYATMDDVGGGGLPPIKKTYLSTIDMLADIDNQIVNFIYYDSSKYWRFLGKTNNDLRDYAPFVKNLSSIIQNGTYSLAGDNITVNPDFIWRIGNLNFHKNTQTVLTITAPSNDQERYSIIYGNSSSNILIENGIAFDYRFASAILPSLPPDTVPLLYIYRRDSSFIEITEITPLRFLRTDISNQLLTDFEKRVARFNISAMSLDNWETRTAPLIQNSGFRAIGENSVIQSRSHHIIRNGAAGSGTTGFFGTNSGSTRQHFIWYGASDVEHTRVGNGHVASNQPTWYFLNPIRFNGALSDVRSSAFNRVIRRDEQRLYYLISITTSGTINDQALTDGIFNYRFNNATEITGFANGEIGRTIDIDNDGTGNLELVHQSTASIEANRMLLPGNANIVIPPKGKLTLKYCTGFRWELVSKNF